jgi:hypothetical protein
MHFGVRREALEDKVTCPKNVRSDFGVSPWSIGWCILVDVGLYSYRYQEEVMKMFEITVAAGIYACYKVIRQI